MERRGDRGGKGIKTKCCPCPSPYLAINLLHQTVSYRSQTDNGDNAVALQETKRLKSQ